MSVEKICSQLCNEKALNILKSDTHQILTNCSIHNTTCIPRRWFSSCINIKSPAKKISPLFVNNARHIKNQNY